jgi:hypothetical protein
MSKKRSKGQRIGTQGENEFRGFAERHSLIANKAEQDFGTDFLCLRQGHSDARGVAQVLGGVFGAFVRATTSRRGRVKLDRDDAEHLLGCEYPIAIVVPHLVDPVTIHARFVDAELAAVLGNFIVSKQKNLYITLPLLRPESAFDTELERAAAPGFVESVRVSLAESGLRAAIPASRIQVHRGPDGAYTLVQVRDFFSQFRDGDETRERLYAAMFGHEALIRPRLRSVPLRDEILRNLARLPQPVVIASRLSAGEHDVEATAVDGTSVKCTFDVRISPGFTGWIHSSGFAITVSERTEYQGQWVHLLKAHTDPNVSVDLAAHADLWRFLEACVSGGKLRLYGEDHDGIDVDNFESLGFYGAFATYLRRIEQLGVWAPGAWKLEDGADVEVLNSMALLAEVAIGGESIAALGFAWKELPFEEEGVRPAWVPIAMNLRDRGLVVWVRTEAHLLVNDGRYVGLRFDGISEVRIDLRDARFKKGRWPEIVVDADLAVPLAPPEERELSDPSEWNCGIRLGSDEDGPPTAPPGATAKIDHAEVGERSRSETVENEGSGEA